MVLCSFATAYAQYGFYNLSGAEGTWKDEYSDDNLKVMLNPATGCGKVTWNPNYYIEFSWQVWLNSSGQPEPSYPNASAGNATFYKLAFTQTASNAPDIAQFGSMIAYYSPNFNGSPAITQYTRMWYCIRTGGSGIVGNCGGGGNSNNNNTSTNNNNGSNNPNSNGGNGNGSGTGANNGSNNGGNGANNNGSGTGSNNNAQYDTELMNLISQMQQYLANGNTSAANNVLNQILQIAQHAYPDQLDELQNIYNQANAQAQQGNTGNNKGSNNHNSSNSSSNSSHGMVMGNDEVDYPEGWVFLQDYQNMLNEYIRQFNLIADGGGNLNNLVAYANKLQNFILSNQHIFGKLTPRQMEVLQRMMDYFQKVMLQAANASLGKMQRIERCNYAEIAKTGYVPAINPQFTTITPGPAPTSSPNSNSSLSGGGSVTPPSINGTGPDGMKRP